MKHIPKMNYQTYKPHKDLESIVKFYWTMEVPFGPKNLKQKIVPDGCIEMTFNLGDKIKRYTSENDFILHPNSMIMGQRTKSYLILPVGKVDTFAICFFPIGFVNFVKHLLKTWLIRKLRLRNSLEKQKPMN
jgi:hypothetical protein